MRHGVICHGDCDGVISAFIYIKHYMRDFYPGRIDIVFTQPWRAHIDARRVSSDIDALVLLDLALSNELVNFIKLISKSVNKVIIIDHHVSSKTFLNELNVSNVKIIWSKASSTPHLIKDVLKPLMNPYEEFLVEVADVCEGNETRNPDVAKVADLIKLSIARDPSDLDYMKYLVDIMLKNKDISNDYEVIKRAKVAKFLLKRLLKLLSERSLEVSNIKIAALDLSESRIYAGLLGIAATEFSKICKKDVILIRREEGKIVVTARSVSDRAFKICQLLSKRLKGKFGGHAEAASTTLPDMPLDNAIKLIIEVSKDVVKRD